MKPFIDLGEDQTPPTIINYFKKIDGVGFQCLITYEGKELIFIPTRGYEVVKTAEGFILIKQ